MSEDEQRRLAAWIAETFEPAKAMYRIGSRVFKHVASVDLCMDVRHGTIEQLMEAAGYEVVKHTVDEGCFYRARLRKRKRNM
jgi:hypothetical protein